MRRWTVAIMALVIGALAAPATAGVQFSTYEGPDAVQTGTGGAKISKEGVDFWTQGTPPRRFQVLGFLTDSRQDKRISGKAIGSKGLARRVTDAGGDALIVINQDSRGAGVVGYLAPNGFGGVNAFGRQVNRITTVFAVVRYLPEAQ